MNLVRKAFSEEAPPPRKVTKEPASSGCLIRMSADQHTGTSWYALWWSIFSLLLVLTGSAAAGEPEYGGNKGKTFSEEEPRYIVRFQGKNYSAIYEAQIEKGIPIDLYYYRIPPHKGVPAKQDGQDLWGRFVRVPSVNDTDQSSVVWWHAWWTYENGRWLYHQADNIPPPKVTKEGQSGARENMRHAPETATKLPKNAPPNKETKKPDVPQKKKPPTSSLQKDLGEL